MQTADHLRALHRVACQNGRFQACVGRLRPVGIVHDHTVLRGLDDRARQDRLDLGVLLALDRDLPLAFREGLHYLALERQAVRAVRSRAVHEMQPSQFLILNHCALQHRSGITQKLLCCLAAERLNPEDAQH